MKRKFSLKRNEEIAKIVKNRKLKKNNSFIVYFSNNDLEFSRVCISVSKKIGIAVIRNKIKRQVREMLDDLLDLNKKIDYVIVVRNDYLNNDFVGNKNDLKDLLEKIN